MNVKKIFKKTVSAVLAAVMMCGLFGGLPKFLPETVAPMKVEASTNGHSADDAIAWCKAQVGKYLYNGQCVGLIVEYYKYLGQAMVYGNAKDYATNSLPSGWQRIAGATPQKGDVLVYTDGQYGHVAIYESESMTYHQNYNYVQYVQAIPSSQWYWKRSGYWGVIRPDFNDDNPSKPTLKVSAGVGNGVTTFSWNSCSKATQYDLRIWKENGDEYKTIFDITDTSYEIILPEGSYTANIAAVNGPAYVWTFSDKVSFSCNGKQMTEKDAAGRTIPDGDYIICSELGQNLYLDIPGVAEDVENGVNLCISKCASFNFSDYDIWTVTYQDDGFYRIKQKSSDTYMDGWGLETNVHTWHNPGGSNSEWSIKQTDHGYMIQARCSGFYVDVYEGKAENGTKVLLYYGKESATNQSWCFIPAKPKQTVSDGLYRIRSAANKNYYLNADGKAAEGYKENTNIQVWDNTDDDVFEITHDKNGYYYISETTSGLVLDLWNGDSDYLNNGRNIQLCKKGDRRNQKWAFVPGDNGAFFIKSQLNGYCMDLLSGQLNKNGGNVEQWTYYGASNQQWILEPVPPESIKITSNPDKQAYKTGDNIDTTGMKVEAVYTNGKKEDITDEVSLKYDFKKPGYSEVTVVYNAGDTALKAVFIVKVTASGDINNDKKFNVSDIVLLKKHLLGVKKLVISTPDSADMNGDGRLNVIDLIIMKRLLVSK